MRVFFASMINEAQALTWLLVLYIEQQSVAVSVYSGVSTYVVRRERECVAAAALGFACIIRVPVSFVRTDTYSVHQDFGKQVALTTYYYGCGTWYLVPGTL